MSGWGDLNSRPSVPQVAYPKPLTCANTWKPPLACRWRYSTVRAGSRCFTTSRGLHEDHSGGYRIETLRPDGVLAGRHLVDHPTPQVTLLATLQRVRPAERRRPGEAGGDSTHDRPRHEGIRCPARIGADRLKPGGNCVELRRAVHEWNGTATSRMTVDSPGRADYQRPLSISGTRD